MFNTPRGQKKKTKKTIIYRCVVLFLNHSTNAVYLFFFRRLVVVFLCETAISIFFFLRSEVTSHMRIILQPHIRLSFKVSRTHKYNTMRRKNPHPQRAVNARTVLKVRRDKEEEVEEEEPLVLCLKIPDEDDDLEANQIQKEEEEEEEEEITVRKGAKRKRGHECDFCEKVFRYPYTCVRTRTRNRTNAMCARSFRTSGVLKVHMRTHANEKPYECDVCEKRYRQSSGLKYHMRTQH